MLQWENTKENASATNYILLFKFQEKGTFVANVLKMLIPEQFWHHSIHITADDVRFCDTPEMLIPASKTLNNST